MDRTQMDIVDLLINMLKEHEKNLDKISERMENTMKMIQQFSGHTLSEEKLMKLDELIEFKKIGYLEGKELGIFTPIERIIEDFDQILKIIRGEG